MLFYYSDIRFWQAVNGVLAVWKRKNKKSAVHFPVIPSLIFPCGNSSSGTFQVFVSAPFIVSICFFINKALGGCWTLGNYTLYI